MDIHDENNYCIFGCGPLVHGTRRQIIYVQGERFARATAGWWCNKCGIIESDDDGGDFEPVDETFYVEATGMDRLGPSIPWGRPPA